MIEEIVLRSACLVNENSWSIDNWLTLVSIIITAIFSKMMWNVAKTQKDIQEKQKNLELFKLRLEHKNKFKSLIDFMNSLSINLNEKIICSDDLIKKLSNDNKQLDLLIGETSYLFSEEIKNIEQEIINKNKDFTESISCYNNVYGSDTMTSLSNEEIVFIKNQIKILFDRYNSYLNIL